MKSLDKNYRSGVAIRPRYCEPRGIRGKAEEKRNAPLQGRRTNDAIAGGVMPILSMFCL